MPISFFFFLPCCETKSSNDVLTASFFGKWFTKKQKITEKWNGNKLMNCMCLAIYYLTNLFVAMTLQKMLHVMRIGIEYASAIALVPSNSCRWSHDATAAAAATILAINWRCITATAAYAAIVIVIAVATVATADGAAAVAIAIERHGNNGAIT